MTKIINNKSERRKDSIKHYWMFELHQERSLYSHSGPIVETLSRLTLLCKKITPIMNKEDRRQKVINNLKQSILCNTTCNNDLIKSNTLIISDNYRDN